MSTKPQENMEDPQVIGRHDLEGQTRFQGLRVVSRKNICRLERLRLCEYVTREFWRYAGSGCVLFRLHHPDLKSDPPCSKERPTW